MEEGKSLNLDSQNNYEGNPRNFSEMTPDRGQNNGKFLANGDDLSSGTGKVIGDSEPSRPPAGMSTTELSPK